MKARTCAKKRWKKGFPRLFLQNQTEKIRGNMTKRYKQRNEIERYFLRLKRFRKIFTRYDKLDVLFCGFIYFAMIVDAI